MATKSMLASLRAALHAEPADDIPATGPEGVPMGGRQDTQEELSMSVNEGKPAGTLLAGITDTAIAEMAGDAVKAARAEGVASGAKAERERLTDILGAEGVKGDGKRMAAALDLAAKSPGMSVEDVTGYVTANVAAALATAADPAGYEAARLNAAGLAAPVPAATAKSGWGDVVAETNKRRV